MRDPHASKLLAAVLLIGACPGNSPATEAYGAARLDHEQAEVEARASQHGSASVPSEIEPLQRPEPVSEPVESAEAGPIASDDRPLNRARDRARSKQPPAPPPSEPPAADASELAAESRLLSLVRRALRDNDFAAALDFAEQHARQHPHGSLTEERLILEAVAACRGARRERGLAAAKQLREQFPSSAAITKVEQSCAGE